MKQPRGSTGLERTFPIDLCQLYHGQYQNDRQKLFAVSEPSDFGLSSKELALQNLLYEDCLVGGDFEGFAFMFGICIYAHEHGTLLLHFNHHPKIKNILNWFLIITFGVLPPLFSVKLREFCVFLISTKRSAKLRTDLTLGLGTD
jgi:hypothetical protein